MRHLDEYRDGARVRALADAIAAAAPDTPVRIMEICGGQTHAIVRNGLDALLPETVTMVHGPGCPVCVTPVAMIDRAIALAGMPNVTLCSFGDMLRVPGSESDLLAAKAAGADVRMVYAPTDAVDLAAANPDRQVVFFGVGFETTVPATAMAARLARDRGLGNFSMLVTHVRVPPAMAAILSDPANRIAGFLAAGHVCAVMGYHEYEPIAATYHVPIVVTGFEPTDILQGIWLCLKQIRSGTAVVQNQYARIVTREGNQPAQALMADVFEIVDRDWRGLGRIPDSGLGFRAAYRDMDAVIRFGLEHIQPVESTACRSGEVLKGAIKPVDCPAFGTTCTPEHPLGATMVSSEGACAAYYRYRYRHGGEQ